jgi:PIN domain nuclease of toxin-antitoxin system
MSYLLDTHILLWWIFDEPKLDTTCRAIINDRAFHTGLIQVIPDYR